MTTTEAPPPGPLGFCADCLPNDWRPALTLWEGAALCAPCLHRRRAG